MPLGEIWDGRVSNIVISEHRLLSYILMHESTLHSCRARSHPRNIHGNDVFTPLTFQRSEQPSETSKPHTLLENLEELDVRCPTFLFEAYTHGKSAVFNNLVNASICGILKGKTDNFAV